MSTKPKGHLYVLSLRDIRLSTTLGHCILIEPNVATRIPEPLRYLAFDHGCVECDPLGNVGQDKTSEANTAPELTLEDVMHQILADGSVSLIGQDGIPKVPEVTKLLGHKTNKASVVAAWMKAQADHGVMMSEGVTREELPKR